MDERLRTVIVQRAKIELLLGLNKDARADWTIHEVRNWISEQSDILDDKTKQDDKLNGTK